MVLGNKLVCFQISFLYFATVSLNIREKNPRSSLLVIEAQISLSPYQLHILCASPRCENPLDCTEAMIGLSHQSLFYLTGFPI